MNRHTNLISLGHKKEKYTGPRQWSIECVILIIAILKSGIPECKKTPFHNQGRNCGCKVYFDLVYGYG